ncbi:ATP-binding cassette domain-containing protein [Nitratireductor sp. CAU 1489]|uniref:ATP-binding cassette domain-containing protein n=1 Tax=Nitratireductor arenosus TaxID=2682096 RepID=A0A844QF00_9HYPH|nr:ATP-binding cassette domain-containing protein [Nitratireductor arenosus]MVA96561.1 ATP-binding cassette domain-containing protein [Nitratireductor arenosus]
MLTATGLRKTFNAGTTNARIALDGVSLSLDEGDFAVIIGGNGAGKSTFLNSVAGEVTVDEGTLAIAGRDVTALPTHRRAGLVSRVFQDPLAGSAGPMTIEENMALASRRGLPSRLRFALGGKRRETYRQMLRVFGLGLENRLTHKVELLSGGQRQSLALAMAILTTPKLLLLDEHCAALDPKTAETVMQATLAAVENQRLTALMVTHNMQHAIDYGNRLVMMMDGRVVFEARGDDKKNLTIEQLVERFHLVDDKMLLA